MPTARKRKLGSRRSRVLSGLLELNGSVLDTDGNFMDGSQSGNDETHERQAPLRLDLQGRQETRSRCLIVHFDSC